MELTSQGYFVPIACRFVPHDQWLVTHLHTTWKISDVKSWLLAKCLPSLFNPIPSIPRQRFAQRRPVSPITFASREDISDDEGVPIDGQYSEYTNPLADVDVALFSDKFKFVPRNLPEASSTGIIPKANTASPCSEPSSYILVSYSTGQILEDQWTFGSFNIHPHELLELHPYPYLTKLPRTTIAEYCQPYFEGHAWVMRLLDNSSTAGRHGDRLGKLTGDGADGEKDKTTRRRRKDATWRERWIVIREGHFHICKDRNECVSLECMKLSTMISIRGQDYLKDFREMNGDPDIPGSRQDFTEDRIICIKFRYEQQSADGSTWFRRGSRDATASEESRKASGSTPDITNLEDEGDDSWAGDTVVLILYMHSDLTFNSILRVLHRDSHPAPSSFLPLSTRRRSPRRKSWSPISFASASTGHSTASSPESIPPSRTRPQLVDNSNPSTVRYPEWRMGILFKAWRAGLGDVGRAMDLARFGNHPKRDDIGSDLQDQISLRKQTRGRASNDKWGVIDNSDSGSESESEREWEGWQADHSSTRARRVPNPNASFTGYAWGDGMQSSPASNYSFPPNDGFIPTRKSLTVPRRTLSHYSSVDSLMQHHIPSRVGERAESPSPGIGRSRPRSPLAAGEFDNSEYFASMDPGVAVTSPQQFIPDVPYPSPRTSHEQALRLSSGSTLHTQRNAVPLSMAMTTITSTVSTGDPPPETPKKSKGKGKARAIVESMPVPTSQQRKRSLTAQPSSPMGRHATTEAAKDSSSSIAVITADGGKERSPTKPGRVKLALTFAEVTATASSAPPSAGGSTLEPPVSTTSSSSFESPMFAHPEDSD